MDSQLWIVIAAIVLALIMAVKPEMFIINPDHRSFRMVRAVKLIGMSVSIMLLVWIVVSLILHRF
jgi:hypothetical protein